MNIDDESTNPLLEIEGIGIERCNTLITVFDIATIEDLAKCANDTAHAIAARLGNVSHRDVMVWIERARTMTAETNGESLLTEMEQAGDGPTDEIGEAESVLGAAHIARIATESSVRSQWEDVATVVVNFQVCRHTGQPEERRIRVHRIQNGGTGKEFDEFDYQGLCQWMSEQVDDIQMRKIVDGISESGKTARQDPAWAEARGSGQINWIRAFQPPLSPQPASTARSGEEFSSRIEADLPFSLETNFSLPGSVVASLVESEAWYCTRFYARTFSTGEKIHLGDSESSPLTRGQIIYVSRLTNASLPGGHYRLRSIVEVRTEESTERYSIAPFLFVG